MECWLGSIVIFQGIQTSITKGPYILQGIQTIIAKEPYIFVSLQWGSRPHVNPPSGSVHDRSPNQLTAAGFVVFLDTISDWEEAVPAMLFFTTRTETKLTTASTGEESESKNKFINKIVWVLSLKISQVVETKHFITILDIKT